MPPNALWMLFNLWAAIAMLTTIRWGAIADAKLAGIGAGTSEILRMLIGRELFSEVN